MSNKKKLFLAFFALFMLVACNNTNELANQIPSIVEEEVTTDVGLLPENETVTEKETALEFEGVPNIHEVQEFETLFSISTHYQIAAKVLQQSNNLGMSTDLQIGQLLRIPPKGSELLQDIQFTLTVINEEDISSLNYKQAVYIQNRGDNNFLIETENTLYDLRIVQLTLGLEFIGLGFTHQYLGDFNLAGEEASLLIRNYVDHSSRTLLGLRFFDDHGVERTFTIGWGPQNIDGVSKDVWEIGDSTHFTN